MPSTKDILAVIMGGGQGTRLFPLTKVRAKPAVPIAGKYRLIDIPISNCINSNIDRIALLTQFNSVSLRCEADRPGALFKALEQFYLQNINLSKIESRPARTMIGDYLFFVDIEGHLDDYHVQTALEGLKPITRAIKILGSYPRAKLDLQK